MADETPEVPVQEAAAPAPVGKMDTMTALQEVLKNAVYVDGLTARGHQDP